MSTIRIALNDVFTGTYILKDQAGVVIDLTAATPSGVVLNLYKVDDGTLVAATPCTISATPTNGVVTYTIANMCSATRQFMVMKFVITKTTGAVLTAPGGQEQGLWVY